jgi:opacity protein-like surface antigen
MKKTLLLAGVACILAATNASAEMSDYTNNWGSLLKDGKVYVGADYAFDDFDFKGIAKDAKKSYNSGIFNVGAKLDRIGAELFGQWTGNRTKDLGDDGKIKTRVNAYGLDLYGYQPLGCEGKYDIFATLGMADYYYKIDAKEDGKSANRIGWRIGGGAMYNITKNISARVVGRYAYIGANSLNHAAEVTAGMRYSF